MNVLQTCELTLSRSSFELKLIGLRPGLTLIAGEGESSIIAPFSVASVNTELIA